MRHTSDTAWRCARGNMARRCEVDARILIRCRRPHGALPALSALLVVLSSTAACSSDADDGGGNGDDAARVVQLGAPGRPTGSSPRRSTRRSDAPTHTRPTSPSFRT